MLTDGEDFAHRHEGRAVGAGGGRNGVEEEWGSFSVEERAELGEGRGEIGSTDLCPVPLPLPFHCHYVLWFCTTKRRPTEETHRKSGGLYAKETPAAPPYPTVHSIGVPASSGKGAR